MRAADPPQGHLRLQLYPEMRTSRITTTSISGRISGPEGQRRVRGQATGAVSGFISFEEKGISDGTGNRGGSVSLDIRISLAKKQQQVLSL